MPDHLQILDGHNDVLSKLLEAEQLSARSAGSAGERATGRPFFERSDQGHIDLPRAREGGFAGGLFSIFVAANPQAPPPAGPVLGEHDGSPVMFPRPLELGYAQRTALAELGILFRLQRQSAGHLRIVHGAADLGACLADGAVAAVIHFEGAEAIDPCLDSLDLFYSA